MKDILENIEKSIPEKLKIEFKKRIVTGQPMIMQFSNQLKDLVLNNHDIRYNLFKNNDDAIYFSGDILARTLYDFWIKGGDLNSHFMESAQMVSFVSEFENIWQ